MKHKITQEVLLIAVLTLTITFLWLFLSVNKALKISEKTLLTPEETRQLVPKLDSGVFDELKKRKI